MIQSLSIALFIWAAAMFVLFTASGCETTKENQTPPEVATKTPVPPLADCNEILRARILGAAQQEIKVIKTAVAEHPNGKLYIIILAAEGKDIHYLEVLATTEILARELVRGGFTQLAECEIKPKEGVAEKYYYLVGATQEKPLT